MFNKQQGEKCGKTFAQPGIIPSRFRDRVAKPLMRNFMDHDIPSSFRSFSSHQIFSIENSGGTFHPAIHTRRLNIGQFLIGKWSHILTVKLQHLFGRLLEIIKSRLSIFSIDPSFNGFPQEWIQILDRKFSHPDHK